MPIGKLVGALIGYFSFRWPGLIIGLLVGHFFDKGRATLEGRFDPEQKRRNEEAFFNAVFPVLGMIAKADGRVSEEEIASTETLMDKMQLSSELRQEAIKLFKSGTSESFQFEETVNAFLNVCGRFGDVKQIYLVYLISLAYADGELHQKEEDILRSVAKSLGYSSFAFNHLLGMVNAQMRFQQHYHQGSSAGAGGSATSADQLALAYKALGVNASDNDAQIKKAYRKLMSENHPDKLAGQGVPEDAIKIATERSQEIQTAYDLIKKSRKA